MKEDRFLYPRFFLEYIPYKEFNDFNMSLGTNFIHKKVSTIIAVIRKSYCVSTFVSTGM